MEGKRDMEEQEMAWAKAQEIAISEDLVAAAKQQLEFLAAVDRRRWLYEGPSLDRAILRYKAFWLPLLATHSETEANGSYLFVPLDCLWIWHCHRLNPVQYKKDCEEAFGKILDNHNVKSSLQGKSQNEMAETWNKHYPEEPFELEYGIQPPEKTYDLHSGAANRITYDLVAAVKRQSTFFYQVSRPCMHDDRYLEAAVARYKAFLYLIKTNQDKLLKRFCVPTYDIDLIWHSHQLHPRSYCNDMLKLLGRVLEHDDTDSDRSKGKKLHTGFTETEQQWEDTYGLRYLRAGAMNRGNLPSSLVSEPYSPKDETPGRTVSRKFQVDRTLSRAKVVEVLLEVVGTRNLPTSQKENFVISFCKKQPDLFLSGTNILRLSTSEEKQVAGFKCEPTGDLILAVISSSITASSRKVKTIGTTSISVEDMMSSDSKLSVERWFELKPNSVVGDVKPVSIYIAASFTTPTPAPYELRMMKSHLISTSSCLLPLPEKLMNWTCFLDQNGHEWISLKIRTPKKSNGTSMREVVGTIGGSKTPFVLAEYDQNKWKLNGYNSTFSFSNKTSYIAEIEGNWQIKFFVGKKLDYEPKGLFEENENKFITAVEFSVENPYGKAVALFDMEYRAITVNEEWFVFPGMVLAFILKDMIKKGAYDDLVSKKSIQDATNSNREAEAEKVKDFEYYPSNLIEAPTTEAGNFDVPSVKGARCGSGCGGGCGGGCGAAQNENLFSRCGSGCGGGCGSCGSCGAGLSSGLTGGAGSQNAAGCGSGCGSCGAESAAEHSATGSEANAKVAVIAAGAGDLATGCGTGCGSCGAEVTISVSNNASHPKHSATGCGSGCGSCGAEVNANAATIAGEIGA